MFNRRIIFLTIMSATFVPMFSMQDNLDRIAQAAKMGDLATIQALDPDGTNPAITNGEELGHTPLYVAAANDQLAIVDYYVKKLEAQCKDINPALTTGPGSVCSPLQIAAQNHNLAIVMYYVKKLESQGKDINPAITAGPGLGATPLHVAAFFGQLSMVDFYVKKLESQGKDINPAITAGTYLGETPLIMAARKGWLAIVDCYVKKLESQGKDINPAMTNGPDSGKTPLYIAADNGSLAIVDYYINKLKSQGKEINPSITTGPCLGWTPFHIALRHCYLAFVDYYIKKLESQGQDINPAIKAGPLLGVTPLGIAATNGHLAVVKALTYRGALLTARDNAGRTAEDVARFFNQQDIVNYLHTIAPLTQQLLKSCNRTKSLIDILAANYQKLLTPQSEISTVHYLEESIKTNRDQIKKLLKQIKQLIEQGAEVNVQGEQGYSPLHCLIGYYNPEGPTQFDEEVRTLIDSGLVNLDAVTDNGDTALSLAAHYGNSRIFKYVLKKGANPRIGINPFMVALENNRLQILRYLLMGPEKKTITYGIKRPHDADENENPDSKRRRLV